jgi:hypothetical protein
MKEYKIKEEVVKGLINYLSQRPYLEVADGIKALQSLEEVKDE